MGWVERALACLGKKVGQGMEAAARCAASENAGQPPVLSSHSNGGLLDMHSGQRCNKKVGGKKKREGIGLLGKENGRAKEDHRG